MQTTLSDVNITIAKDDLIRHIKTTMPWMVDEMIAFDYENESNAQRKKNALNDIAILATNENETFKKALVDAICENEEIVTYINNAIEDAYTEVLENAVNFPKAPSSGIKVPAACILQQWENDYAIEKDSIQFDCAIALDTFSLDYLPHPWENFDDGYCNYGDDVWHTAVNLGIVNEWDGPFECTLIDQDAYEKYIKHRRSHTYQIDIRPNQIGTTPNIDEFTIDNNPESIIEIDTVDNTEAYHKTLDDGTHINIFMVDRTEEDPYWRCESESSIGEIWSGDNRTPQLALDEAWLNRHNNPH